VLRRVAICLLVTGCAFGAPPGFSSGESWTFPLVDPLADGRLIVPVTIHGHGPYLFAIDRDAHSIIDPDVASALNLHAGPLRTEDYDGHTHVAFSLQVTDLRVGDLTLSYLVVGAVTKPGRFDGDGRRIQGILGREVLADSLVFGFDRERGIAWLRTENTFAPPPEAAELRLTDTTSTGGKVYWQPVVEGVQVGGLPVDVHPTFAALGSELLADRWNAANLSPRAVDLDVVDRSGIRRRVVSQGVAEAVTVARAGVTREHIAFAPYGDQRYWSYHLDGTLGLDFFRPYAVAADWHHGKIYVTPRKDSPSDQLLRFARWGSPLSCLPGCAHLEVVDPRAEHAIQPVALLQTDASLTGAVELVIAATGKAGPLPNLIVNLPDGVHGLASRLDPDYLGASLAIVDASPFPRHCDTTFESGGCIMKQAEQQVPGTR
jgi:hypothetical protein